MKKAWWFYILVLVLASLIRFIVLDRIPAGLVSDELDYVLNAKSIYLTGQNIYGTWSPFSLTPIAEEYPKAELPYLVSIPFVGPYAFNLLNAKAGYAIISIFFVVALMLIADSLFGHPVGMIAGLVAAINPWSVYFGRTAYDVPVAVTAYMLGTALLLRWRRWGVIAALLLWVFAFYSYIGMKLFFLPFALFTLAFVFWKRKKVDHWSWYIAAGIALCGFFVFYLLHIQASGIFSRAGELFTPFSSQITAVVDSQRRLAIQNPFTVLFSNKAVVFGKEVVVKVFGAFNPNLLFTNGEGIATFSLWDHGVFYYTDSIFFIVGMGALFLKRRGTFGWLTAILFIGTIPSVLSTVGISYVHRSSLMYPVMLIAIAYGLWTLVRSVKKPYRAILGLCVVFLYTLQLANFAYTYFLRFPYFNSEAFGLSARVYSKFMNLADTKGQRIVFLDDVPDGSFRKYVFYSDALSEKTIPQIKTALKEKQYEIRNVIFTAECPTKEELSRGDVIYIFSDGSKCRSLFAGQNVNMITSLGDGGTLYRIYHDTVCGGYMLHPYPGKYLMSDFLIEELPESRFCEQFIIRHTDPRYMPLKETPVVSISR